MEYFWKLVRPTFVEIKGYLGMTKVDEVNITCGNINVHLYANHKGEPEINIGFEDKHENMTMTPAEARMLSIALFAIREELKGD